jgi:hypothetical protein
LFCAEALLDYERSKLADALEEVRACAFIFHAIRFFLA